MTAALEAHLRECTIRLIDSEGETLGTAFFVANGMALTAAHVVVSAGDEIKGIWGKSRLESLTVQSVQQNRESVNGVHDLPDIALIRIDDDLISGHPCVALGDSRPSGGELLAEGYARGVNAEPTSDSARLRFESERIEGGYTTIKCMDARVDNGLSGGPLLDLGTGTVVGITKARRVGAGPIGSFAISAKVVRELYPELWAANVRHRRGDRRWDFARLCHGASTTPEAALNAYLRWQRQSISKRPVIVPREQELASIQQIPTVRAIQGPESESDAGLGETTLAAITDLSSADGLFRWLPARAHWQTVVLTGMPGMGKSCLLAVHCDALAVDALNYLASPGADPFAIPVPALVDCATLGSALPNNVSQDSAIAALASVLATQAGKQGDDDAASWINAVVSLAYENGRLVTCLDALDEVTGLERQRVLQALTFLAGHGNKLMVTSRPQPRLRDEMAKVPAGLRAEVLGFSPGQVYAFAKAWFGPAQDLMTRFEEGLNDRVELRNLARIPLLAAFLCRLVSKGSSIHALPTSVASLYRAMLETCGWAGRGRTFPVTG